MRQAIEMLAVETSGPGLTEITQDVARVLAGTGIMSGLVTIYCQHTSASLLVQENADRDVRRDLQAFFRRLVPDGDPLFIHTAEGPDDMPAHIKAALTQTSLAIPVAKARMLLGTWQGIYLFEHRTAPHTRHVVVHVIGDR
jgi:secondary thiamine-phosphate synthase enzyme